MTISARNILVGALRFGTVACVIGAAACAPGSTMTRNTSDGFCFEAEGLRRARCHVELASCQRSESILRDQSPYAVIESECAYRSSHTPTPAMVADEQTEESASDDSANESSLMGYHDN